MPDELLNPGDRLEFPASFRSLMTQCEVKGDATADGAGAFEVDSGHMLPWLERNGLERAGEVNAYLKRLIGRLEARRGGTVWSDDFDFNHRWPVAEARAFFESWRRELDRAVQRSDAKSIVLLSLLQRARETGRFGDNTLGVYFVVPVTEREFNFLDVGDAILDAGSWICVPSKRRRETGPVVILWWLAFYCGRCGRALQIEREPEDGNDLWKMSCCVGETWAESVTELALKWFGLNHGSRTVAWDDV